MQAIVGAMLMASLVMGAWTKTATAQEMYESSEPSYNEELKESPKVIAIKFSQRIYFKDVHLFAEGRAVEWPLEWTKTEDDVFGVEIRVVKPLPPGHYQVEWWADVRQHHHDDGGVILFTVAP